MVIRARILLAVTLGCAPALLGCETMDREYASAGTGGNSASSSAMPSSSGAGGAGGGCELKSPICGIEEVASEVSARFGDIALSKSFVYWVSVTDGSIKKLGKNAPASVPESLLSTQGYDQLASVDSEDEQTYVGAPGAGVYKISSLGVAEVVDDFAKPRGLAVNDGFVYWPSLSDLKIHRGSTLATETLVDDTGAAPARIAASDAGKDVYWTYQGDMSPTGGGVRKLNQATDFAPAQDRPSGIDVDQDAVYWMTADGSVNRMPKAGGSITKTKMGAGLDKAAFLAGRVVVRNGWVYWLGPDKNSCPGCACDESCNAVLAAPVSSMDSAVVFASGPTWTELLGLAADDTYVYWTVTTKGGAYVLRKPIPSP